MSSKNDEGWQSATCTTGTCWSSSSHTDRAFHCILREVGPKRIRMYPNDTRNLPQHGQITKTWDVPKWHTKIYLNMDRLRKPGMYPNDTRKSTSTWTEHENLGCTQMTHKIYLNMDRLRKLGGVVWWVSENCNKFATRCGPANVPSQKMEYWLNSASTTMRNTVRWGLASIPRSGGRWCDACVSGLVTTKWTHGVPSNSGCMSNFAKHSKPPSEATGWPSNWEGRLYHFPSIPSYAQTFFGLVSITTAMFLDWALDSFRACWKPGDTIFEYQCLESVRICTMQCNGKRANINSIATCGSLLHSLWSIDGFACANCNMNCQTTKNLSVKGNQSAEADVPLSK